MPYRSQVVMQGFGVRLPQTLVEQIDVARGDVNRSRYIQRLIEKNVNAIRSEPMLGEPTQPNRPKPRSKRG